MQIDFPTKDADDEEVELYSNQLENLLSNIPNREIRMIIGDFNAKVGRDNEDHELRRTISKYG